MKHSIVSRITEGAFRYQGWPTVTKGEDGTLYVGASGHRLNHVCPFGKNLMYVSFDEGESWSCPQIVNDSYLDDRDAGMLAWGDGNLLLTFFSTSAEKFEDFDLEDGKPHVNVRSPLAMGMRALWDTLSKDQLHPGSYTRISRDNGKTWSEPRPAPVSSPHGPCRLKDGSLLFVGSIVTEGSFDSTDHTKRIQAFRSCDDGKTWHYLSHIPYPEGADQAHHEPHAIQMANGDILVAVRYENTYTPVMKSMRIYTALSHDNGKTWEKAGFLDQHGAPPHLLQHSSGAVILSYSRRLEPMGQYVRVSRDFGKTWSKDTMISPEESTGIPAWDHGYPSSVELANGDILTVYYQKCPGDGYCSLHSIRWSLDELE
ncbi:MAG: exo-alpha-sialidase [Clostridia bacterium]|nr:exo-alpha-sialidase [Clostridia bacterium]